ncbi:MAG: outer membrane beta-barrel protein [Candidatus Eisenbacteria bacterium]
MKRALMLAAFIAGATACAEASKSTIEGFVDASYAYDANAERGEFGLDQVELDLLHAAGDRTSARADLEWVKSGEEFNLAVEQGYLTYKGRGWGFTLGRFNAPIGFELLDAPDMYQYSHALVFTYALPTNLTGLMVERSLAGGLSALAYAVNGWDQNAEDNRLATWGGRLGLSRGMLAGGLSIISGREGSEPELDRTVFDIDLSARPAGWVLGAEVNAGGVKSAGGERQTWVGLLAMAHRDFNTQVGLTVRYDYLDDKDSFVFGSTVGTTQTRQAITVAPTLALDEGVGVLLELRIDLSDQKAFIDPDGVAKDTQTSLAFEATCRW